MPLDPILKRLIAKAYHAGFADIHHFNSEEMRRFLTHPKLKVTQASFKDFQIHSAVSLRCYQPATLCTTSPAVIYISATAFVIDRIDANNDYCSLLANNLGMKIIHVAHRLAPEHKFPRFLYDCLDSIHWIHHHAADLGIEQDKIALWGESSGASIAAACTHILRDQKLPIIKHQTLFYPMVDLVTPYPSKESYGQGYMLDKAFIQWLDARGFEPDQDRSHPHASPLLSPNFTDLPPATIITAECDPLRDEGEAYVQKLQLAGVKVHAKRFQGMIHGFMRFYNKVSAANEALAWSTNLLQQFYQLPQTQDQCCRESQ